jgi:hypothetical protein
MDLWEINPADSKDREFALKRILELNVAIELLVNCQFESAAKFLEMFTAKLLDYAKEVEH